MLQDLKDGLVLRTPRTVRAVRWPETWEERNKPIANARELVKWIKNELQQVFPCQGLQQSLSPFDLTYWKDYTSSVSTKDPMAETRLLQQHFKDLAACRGSHMDEAIAGFFRVRNLADAHRKLGDNSVTTYWGKALRERNALHAYPDLVKLIAPALAQFLGNGELEGDFSSIKAIGINARHLGPDLVRATVKVRLDGPHPTDLRTLASGEAM